MIDNQDGILGLDFSRKGGKIARRYTCSPEKNGTVAELLEDRRDCDCKSGDRTRNADLKKFRNAARWKPSIARSFLRLRERTVLLAIAVLSWHAVCEAVYSRGAPKGDEQVGAKAELIRSAPSPVPSRAECNAEAKPFLDAKDPSESLLLFDKAAALSRPSATSDLGDRRFYLLGGPHQDDDTQVREWYQKAAAVGDADAMYHLGIMYENGLGGAQDYAEAREWYQKAVKAGKAEAAGNLGNLYEHGAGGVQDNAQARACFKKAASVGDTLAMYNLGYLYKHGLGGEQDYAQARKWYEMAASAGDANAMYDLGYLYEHGLGGVQDWARAREWYNKSAAGSVLRVQQKGGSW
jgi:hypothetical protein